MTDKEKLREVVRLAYGMYYAAQYMTTDASRLRRAMDEYHRFIITEYNRQEPVSEDLEKEIDRYFNTEGIPVTGDALKDTARYFAQWQERQMMKDTVEGMVCGKVIDHINVRVEGYNALTPSNITHIPCERKNFHKFKIGDKVKVIIIKE